MLVSAACNNKGTTPSNTPALAGNWSGTIQYTVNGAAGQQALTMNLGQVGTAVTGTYSVNSIGYFSGGNAAITGGATTQSFTGSMVFSPSSNPNACSGTIQLAGNSLGTSVTWSSTGITSTCGSFTPTTVTLSATHQ